MADDKQKIEQGVQLYFDSMYESDPAKLDMDVSAALEDLVKIALQLCKIKKYCGTETPTVIT